MLKFPHNSLSFHLEEFLAAVDPSIRELDISIPESLYLQGGLGSSTQAVQAIAQLSKSAKLRLHISQSLDGADSGKFLRNSLHGIAAAYFADELALGDEVFSRNQTLKSLVPRVMAMRSQNHGATKDDFIATLCCFSGARNEYLPALYSRPSHFSVRPPSELSIAFGRMLKAIDSNNATQSITDGAQEYIAKLLHELFANADEHGSFNPNGEPLKRGMRGIHMQITSMRDAHRIAHDSGDDTALRFYLASLPLIGDFPADSTPSLLEMTIFDTGPGMGLSWLSRMNGNTDYTDFSRDEELEAVSTCFRARATTKSNSVRGQGLPEVLRAMRKLGAFMMLRTGRMSLYQDFSRAQSDDFSPKARFGGRQLPETSGTSFTIWFRIS